MLINHVNPCSSSWTLQYITLPQLSLLLVFLFQHKFLSCNEAVLHSISEFAQHLIFSALPVTNECVCFGFNVLIILGASFSSFAALLLLYL